MKQVAEIYPQIVWIKCIVLKSLIGQYYPWISDTGRKCKSKLGDKFVFKNIIQVVYHNCTIDIDFSNLVILVILAIFSRV